MEHNTQLSSIRIVAKIERCVLYSQAAGYDFDAKKEKLRKVRKVNGMWGLWEEARPYMWMRTSLVSTCTRTSFGSITKMIDYKLGNSFFVFISQTASRKIKPAQSKNPERSTEANIEHFCIRAQTGAPAISAPRPRPIWQGAWVYCIRPILWIWR